jgi:tight adherence protein C
MPYLIAVVIFAAAGLAAWGILRPKENVIAQRLRPASYQEVREEVRERVLEGSLAHRVIAPLAGRTGILLSRLVPQDSIRRLDHLLVMAGEPMPLPLYLAFWATVLLSGGLFILFVALARPELPRLQLFGLILFVLLFFGYSPYAILKGRVRNRQTRIIRALPDALDLLVTCMEAGLGVDAAIAKVTQKSSGPLAETFTLYLKQVGLGRARRDALAYVAERSGVPDLVRLAAAVVQAEALGTTLGDVMRMQAEDLRQARSDRAREAAHKAPVKMTIPLVIFFLPAMGIVVVVPPAINLVRFLGGVGFLGGQ